MKIKIIKEEEIKAGDLLEWSDFATLQMVVIEVDEENLLALIVYDSQAGAIVPRKEDFSWYSTENNLLKKITKNDLKVV